LRQIVLDTETTGLDPRLGHRIIEIGGVELVGRKLTGQRFHRYINPKREIEAGAAAVHGITDEMLVDKPEFAEIADELVAFLRDAELVIHNAAFDIGFLNAEFGLLGQAPVEEFSASVVDTLKLAREMHPGRRNSLDALCERYAVDNSGRQLHGALLDAELLAEVYLAMTRGQESLDMELDAPAAATGGFSLGERPALRVIRANEAELTEHQRVLEEIGKESKGKCLWPALATVEPPT
jgi:DNA polymerase-3 subunit epsilon